MDKRPSQMTAEERREKHEQELADSVIAIRKVVGDDAFVSTPDKFMFAAQRTTGGGVIISTFEWGAFLDEVVANSDDTARLREFLGQNA